MGVVNQVQTLLDMKKVVSAGPFLYAFIPDGTPDSKFFSRPNCLMLLGRFLLEAYVKLVSYNFKFPFDEHAFIGKGITFLFDLLIGIYFWFAKFGNLLLLA